MFNRTLFLIPLMIALVGNADAQDFPTLTAKQSMAAAANYQQYCALCHGEDRQGHVNDHAPSLRSKSLMEAGFSERLKATGYGRHGTPMAGYFDEIGGPLDRLELIHLTLWLQEQSGVEYITLPRGAISGDISQGEALYARECADCHGAQGEGGTGTALGNAAMLSMTGDAFLRHAIDEGRQGTDMPAFGDSLTAEEMDAVTAFIRSRATGWQVRKPVLRSPPSTEEYVLNPNGEVPGFKLKDDLYVTSTDLHDAMRDNRRMVLLDTRAISAWQLAHIEGAIPLPYYYEDVGQVANDLPRDGTLIVTYCTCPRAAAEQVNAKLVAEGFENTAVLWEGLDGWISFGYPISHGATTLADTQSIQP